jgi:hypothetical protein
MDIQGIEKHVVPAARHLLLQKVVCVHIGTHHIVIHQAIRHMLRQDNWYVDVYVYVYVYVQDAGSRILR